MARRKRLGPAAFGPESETDPQDRDASALPALEVKAALRPPGGLGTAPPIARVAAETAAAAALSEIAEAMTRARDEGRLVLRLPLPEIEAEHLVRDRLGIDEEELSGLMASIAEHGQRTPIEVSEIAPGRYGLISGWRRLTALRRLAAGGEARFGHVLALVRRPDTAAEAYIAMVEENEIRLGLSYYERARIAARAVERGVFPDSREALRRLFANASRARRSKIGSFLTLYQHFDGVLAYPTAIPERLGLALEKRLATAEDGVIAAFKSGLVADPASDAASEQARLTDFAMAEDVSRAKQAVPAPAPAQRHPEPGPERPSPRQEIRPGLYLVETSRGELTLSGPALDADLRERLAVWLADAG